MDTPTDNTNATAPVESENPFGDAGGTLGFEAARAMRDAFDASNLGAATPPSEPETTKATAESAPKEAPKAAGAPSAADTLVEALRGKAKEAPKPEADDIGDDVAPTPGAKTAWAEQRRALKEERAKRQELEARLGELEKAPKEFDSSELTALRELVNAQERTLDQVKIEATRQYREAVTDPLNRINSSLAAASKKYEIRESDLRSAFSEADPERQTELLIDLASGMNDRDRFKLYELAEEHQSVQQLKANILNDAKVANEKVADSERQAAERALEEGSRHYASAVDAVWNAVGESIPIFKHRQGDPEWNATLDSVVQTAKGINVDTLGIPQRADLTLRAAAAPFLYSQLLAMAEKYQETRAALETYTTTSPGAGGGGTMASSPEPEYEDFLDAVRAGLA